MYKGKPTACASCHQTEFNNSTNPHHVQAKFSALCASCHTTTRWPGGTYNHNTQTSFPLSGNHATAKCIDCHSDKVYNGKPTTCVSCHQTNGEIIPRQMHTNTRNRPVPVTPRP
mgnify:CR=1 FL=1